MSASQPLPRLSILPRPIVPAPSSPSAEDDLSPIFRPKAPSKRTQITAVACGPCQQRKTKCDGQRPTCTSCEARNRSQDCVYDAAGDQRRTSHLKQKNHDLEMQAAIYAKQVDEYKDIVRALCSTSDVSATVRHLELLLKDNFQSLAEVAAALRSQAVPIDSDREGSRASDEPIGEKTGNAIPLSMDLDPILENIAHSYIEQPAFSMQSGSEIAPDLTCITPWNFSDGPRGTLQGSWASSGSISPAQPLLSFPYGSGTHEEDDDDDNNDNNNITINSNNNNNSSSNNNSILAPRLAATGDFEQRDADNTGQRYLRTPRYFHQKQNEPGHTLWIDVGPKISAGEHPLGARVLQGMRVPIFALQAADTPDDELSTAYRMLVAAKRQLLEQGWGVDEIVGSKWRRMDIPLFGLVNNEGPLHPQQTVCQWVGSFVTMVPFRGETERLAMWFLLVSFIRWHILPTQEHYQLIPECLRPTAEQVLTPHRTWIDFIPWPRLRDAFILSTELAQETNGLHALSNHMCVNWPTSFHELCAASDGSVTGEQFIDMFQQHVSDVNNWSLTSNAEQLYPTLFMPDKVWIAPDIGEATSSIIFSPINPS